jgi:uncharacterized protein
MKIEAAVIAAWIVRGYQLVVRPVLPPACRFAPSCSEYARQVLLTHGVLRGGGLALRRVGRCHPWHAGGDDPPPPKQDRVTSAERPGG